jgi:hypothetical protein
MISFIEKKKFDHTKGGITNRKSQKEFRTEIEFSPCHDKIMTEL